MKQHLRILLALAAALRAEGAPQLVNGGFESGPIGGVPDGWSYVGPLERNADNPGEHGSVGLRAAPNTLGGGNGVTTTVDGANFLNGGRDSVYYQQVTPAMVPGTVYRFSAYATVAGSSGPITRLSFTAVPLTVGTFATEPRLAQTAGIRGDQTTPPEWLLNVVSYAAQPADAGLPLYANLESYRDVSTAVIGWDAANVVSFSTTVATLDAGGGRTTNGTVVNDGSLGGIAGISSAGAAVAKHGYIGQLTEVTALQLAATPTTVDESGTRQLSAVELLDDDSTTALAATDVTWSVQSGPLAGIDASGLATAAIVYQDSAAVAQGDYAGATGILNLTVLDTIPDNFGSYAGDGLGDDWQFQFFGLDNPDAAPLLDPDGDGQNNRFEFTAGLVPTDPLSRFSIAIAPVAGQPGQKDIIFDPIVAGRSYTVMTSPDLTPGSWDPLAGGSFSDDGDQRTVTDPAASGTKKFYTVEIVKP